MTNWKAKRSGLRDPFLVFFSPPYVPDILTFAVKQLLILWRKQNKRVTFFKRNNLDQNICTEYGKEICFLTFFLLSLSLFLSLSRRQFEEKTANCF
jgi:hypothetical protein